MLAREEFACRAPYTAQNIPDDADLIVIGKNARLVPNENDEVAEAFTRAARPGGPKILSFAEVLALVPRGHENIVVAGSFGKTTSVSMMAHCLASAGLKSLVDDRRGAFVACSGVQCRHRTIILA